MLDFDGPVFTNPFLVVQTKQLLGSQSTVNLSIGKWKKIATVCDSDSIVADPHGNLVRHMSKEKLKNKRSGEPLDQSEASRTWECLKEAIRQIHSHNASSLSFEELYRNAYNLVLHKYGESTSLPECAYRGERPRAERSC